MHPAEASGRDTEISEPVHSFGSTNRNICQRQKHFEKSIDDLKLLRSLKLGIIYLGVETGDEDLTEKDLQRCDLRSDGASWPKRQGSRDLAFGYGSTRNRRDHR